MQCPVCKKEYKAITVQHIRTHSSVEEFKNSFPNIIINSTARDACLKSKLIRVISDNLICENPLCKKVLSSSDRKKRKFCSNSCKVSVLNKKRVAFKQCLFCNTKIKYKRKSNFCTLLCRVSHRRYLLTEKWLRGELDLNSLYDKGNSPVPKKFIRQYLLDTYKNKCQKCGWGEINAITGNVPLQIHHIDGDCKNNILENLELLCPNCHSLTSTYGSLNNGNSKRVYRYS